MSDDMPRPVTVPDERLLDELEKGDSPIRTVSEIESEVNLSADGIRRRLLKLEDEGRAVSKTVGASAVVWWRSD
jgi:DNA-binding Lrp family transcriptional regulator